MQDYYALEKHPSHFQHQLSFISMKITTSFLVAPLVLVSTITFAQLPKTLSAVTSTSVVETTKGASTTSSDSTANLLDKAVSATSSGDKAATVLALKSSVASLEKTASTSKTDFKDKLMAQAGTLQKLIPLAESGMLGTGVIQKAASLAKIALGANQLSSLLSAGSLVSQASALTSNLGLLKTGLSSLGGVSGTTGGSLVGSALSSVSALTAGGAAAEPAAKNSLSSVLSFAKGIL